MLSALKSVPGVLDAKVTFVKRKPSKAAVSVGDSFDPQAVIDALKKENFSAKLTGGS